jgi:hypothetical protein
LIEADLLDEELAQSNELCVSCSQVYDMPFPFWVVGIAVGVAVRVIRAVTNEEHQPLVVTIISKICSRVSKTILRARNQWSRNHKI